MFCFKNFNHFTIADWTRCEIPETPPDFVSFTGSSYWDFGDKVRRWSDHWCQTRTCKWFLGGIMYEGLLTCGECYYEDFYPIVGREPMPAYRNVVFKDVGEDRLEVRGPCVFSGMEYAVIVPKKAYLEWRDGKGFVQDIPGLTLDEREFIMSGITPEEFDAQFGEE